MNLLTAAEQALASIPLPPADRRAAARGESRSVGGVGRQPGDNAEPAARRPSRDETLDLRIELGRTHIGRDEVRKLRTGSVVPLDNAAGDPVDLYAGGRLIARGEVLVLDGKFGSSRGGTDVTSAERELGTTQGNAQCVGLHERSG